MNRQREAIKQESTVAEDADEVLEMPIKRHKAVTTNTNTAAVESDDRMNLAYTDTSMQDLACKPAETDVTYGSKKPPKLFGPFLPLSQDQLTSMRWRRNPRARAEDISGGPKKRILVNIEEDDELPSLSATNRLRRSSWLEHDGRVDAYGTDRSAEAGTVDVFNPNVTFGKSEWDGIEGDSKPCTASPRGEACRWIRPAQHDTKNQDSENVIGNTKSIYHYLLVVTDHV